MGYLTTKKSNAIIVNNTQAPPGCHLVITTPIGLAAGDEPRVFASITESGDGLYAQLSVRHNHGILSLCERRRGVDTELCEPQKLSGIKPGEDFSLAICCDNSKVAAMAKTNSGNVVRCRGTSLIAGEKFGLGTGKVKHTVLFDDLECKHHFPASCSEHPFMSEAGCPDCGEACPCCEVSSHLN